MGYDEKVPGLTAALWIALKDGDGARVTIGGVTFESTVYGHFPIDATKWDIPAMSADVARILEKERE